MSKETTKVENFYVILAHEGKQFALIKVNSKPYENVQMEN